MAILRVPIQCYRCNGSVNPGAAMLVDQKMKRYQCYACYQKQQPRWRMGKEETKVKENYFCGRCKYKFKALAPRCPYCSSSDHLSRAEFSMDDLL